MLGVGTWREDLRDLLGTGPNSTFILRCLGIEKCSLTFHKETQLQSYSSLPPFTQSTEKQLKERTALGKRATGGRRIPLQWCNSFSAVTLSLSLPCGSNTLNTHWFLLQAPFCTHTDDPTSIPLPWQRGRAVETGDATASPFLLAQFLKPSTFCINLSALLS